VKRALVVVAPLAVFVLASGRVLPPLAVVVALLAVAIAALIAPYPNVAAPLAIVFIACVPVYWGRAIGGLGLAIIPVTIVGVMLLPAAVREGWRFRTVTLDVLVGIYLVLRSLSFVLNYGSGLGAAVGYSSRIVAGYGVFRLLSLVPGIRRRLALAVVVAGGLLTIPAYLELSRRNPFFGAVKPSFQADAWARPEVRLGTVRVEASFGHPIPFGMFLAIVVVLAVALAVSVRHGRQVIALLVIAATAAVTLLNTLSRGPLLVAGAALVVWVLLEVRLMSPGRVAALAAVLVGVLVLTPALSIVDTLWTASSGDTHEARSAEYRLEVASVLFDRSQFSLLGRETTDSGEVSRAVAQRVGLKSIDNEYAIVFVAGGLLSLLSFATIGLQVLRLPFWRGLDPVDRAWMVALGASFLNLATVALLTQFSDLFWISVAVAAAIVQERQSQATRPSSQFVTTSDASAV